jgi:hypothetical protein
MDDDFDGSDGLLIFPGDQAKNKFTQPMKLRVDEIMMGVSIDDFTTTHCSSFSPDKNAIVMFNFLYLSLVSLIIRRNLSTLA